MSANGTSREKPVVIIGGGFAGLSAATALAEQGVLVHVLEGRQVLGGRAYSFIDTQTKDSVDNGQHLFMGCYEETIAFLKRIGTIDRLKFQTNLQVDFVGDRGRRSKLFCWPLPSPLHLLTGLLGLSTLSWGDRFRMLSFDKALRKATADPKSVETLTVSDWLKRSNQSVLARRHFWDLITIAALNEDPDRASAASLLSVLSRAFFGPRAGSRLGLASVGLSDLYTEASNAYLRAREGTISVKSPVARLILEECRVTAVELRDGTRIETDTVISAVPPSAFLKLMPEALRESDAMLKGVAKLSYAPIISIHLWFDREVTDRVFEGLLDTQVQWLFNKEKISAQRGAHKGNITLIISGAHAFADWDENRVLTLALEELRRLYPSVHEASLVRSIVIKEQRATLSPVVGSEAFRPEPQSPFTNLLIAGDWTRTGLPATIESACVSGHRCAGLLMQRRSGISYEAQELAHV